jgi:hypothetical protein
MLDGWGEELEKRKKVRKLIRKEGMKVMAIQESKLGAVDKNYVQNYGMGMDG